MAFWLFAFSQTLTVALMARFIGGLAIGPLNAMAVVIIQVRAPERMLGRVLGFLTAMTSLAAPAGMLIGGYLVEWWSIDAALILTAAGVSIAALWMAASPGLRAAAPELDASDEEQLAAV